MAKSTKTKTPAKRVAKSKLKVTKPISSAAIDYMNTVSADKGFAASQPAFVLMLMYLTSTDKVTHAMLTTTLQGLAYELKDSSVLHVAIERILKLAK